MIQTHEKMQVNARADSSARGIEAVWDGLVRDCETSLVRKMSADEVCPAAPSTSSKTMKVEPVPPSKHGKVMTLRINLPVKRVEI